MTAGTGAALVRSAALGLAFAVLAGCAGAPGGASGAAPVEHAVQTPPTTETAEQQMETATVSSLTEAAKTLAAGNIKETPAAVRLQAFGGLLFARLYPELQNPFPPAGSPAESASQWQFFQDVDPALSLLAPGPPPDDQQASTITTGLDAAEAANARSILPPYLRAVLFRRQGRPAQTIQPLYEECLRRDPSFYPAKVGLIQAAIDEGRAVDDEQALMKLATELPSPAAIQGATARILFAVGRPEQAADAAAHALLEAPGSTDLLLLRAQASAAMGDWYRSLSLLDSLLGIDPGARVALALKATLLFEKAGNPDAAMQIASRGETEFPHDAAFPELRGRVFLSRGNVDEGEKELAAALLLDPERVSVLALLARSAAAGERWQEAAAYVERIPERRRNPDVLRLAWQIAMKLSDYDRAQTLAQELREKDSRDSRLVFSVRTLLAAGKPVEARDLATSDLRAVTAPDVRASLHVLRALAARQAGGDTDAELQDLRAALLENPDDREALLAVADALAAAGDYRKALAYLKHAQELSPDDASVRARVNDMSRRASSEE